MIKILEHDGPAVVSWAGRERKFYVCIGEIVTDAQNERVVGQSGSPYKPGCIVQAVRNMLDDAKHKQHMLVANSEYVKLVAINEYNCDDTTLTNI